MLAHTSLRFTRGNTKNILIIDDEVITTQLLTSLLAQSIYKISIALSKQSGICLSREELPYSDYLARVLHRLLYHSIERRRRRYATGQNPRT